MPTTNKHLALPGRSKKILDGRKLTEVEEKALDLRGAGASYREIAKALGFKSADSALQAVKRGIAKTQFETATESLVMDLANLDDWMKRVVHRLRTTGDLSQIDRAMRIMQKRHELLGVDSTTLAEKMGKKTTAGGATIVVAPSENAFIEGMMRAVGVDPESPAAQAYFTKKGPDKGTSVGEESQAHSPKEIEAAPKKKTGTTKKKKLVVKKAKPTSAQVVVDAVVMEKAEPSEPVIVPTLHDIYPMGQAPTLRETTI